MRTLIAVVIGIVVAGCGPSAPSIDMCQPTVAVKGAPCIPGCGSSVATSCTCDGTTMKWVCPVDGGAH